MRAFLGHTSFKDCTPEMHTDPGDSSAAAIDHQVWHHQDARAGILKPALLNTRLVPRFLPCCRYAFQGRFHFQKPKRYSALELRQLEGRPLCLAVWLLSGCSLWRQEHTEQTKSIGMHGQVTFFCQSCMPIQQTKSRNTSQMSTHGVATCAPVASIHSHRTRWSEFEACPWKEGHLCDVAHQTNGVSTKVSQLFATGKMVCLRNFVAQ